MTDKIPKRRYNVERKDKTIEFRISEADWKEVSEIAKAEDKNISAMLRTIVKEYIQKIKGY